MLSPSHDLDTALGILPSEVGRTRTGIEWQAAGENLCSATAKLDVGGLVYLSVEGLGSAGWDWLVWDADCQALPRHGLATTESAAKLQAEQSMQDLNALLLELLGTPSEAEQRRD